MTLPFRSAVLGLALVCASAAAAPWPAAARAAQPSPDEGAQQAFRAGVDAARQENWVEARTQFEKAYALSPRPVVLINLAGAQTRTGRLKEAARNYRRILDDPGSPETVSFRKAAADILPALEARIPRVRVRSSGLTPLDVIQIDGDTVKVDEMNGGYPLDPGEHTLIVHHAGNERARVLFTLAERELRDITLPLPAVRPPPSVVPPLAIESSPGGTPASSEPATARSWWRSPWTWGAVAVVVAGSALTTFVLLERRDQPFVGNITPGKIEVR